MNRSIYDMPDFDAPDFDTRDRDGGDDGLILDYGDNCRALAAEEAAARARFGDAYDCYSVEILRAEAAAEAAGR